MTKRELLNQLSSLAGDAEIVIVYPDSGYDGDWNKGTIDYVDGNRIVVAL